MKLAAIDIGSNASRLLIAEAFESGDGLVYLNKINLVRVPLRLGFDVFDNQIISSNKCRMIYETMHSYRHLMNAYEIKHYKACATSAMRDATNSHEIITYIRNECNIDIEIISGSQEAALVYENHIAEGLDTTNVYLYIDVGGGSTEVTFFNNGKCEFTQSFNIGTIRLLKKQVTLYEWEQMKATIKENITGHNKIVAIGSGGNINKIFSLSRKKDGKALSIELLKDYYKELSNVSLEQRIEIYKLREDRADVIVPALQIFINIMRWANIDDIYVPKIGLVDGLIKSMYQQIKNMRT